MGHTFSGQEDLRGTPRLYWSSCLLGVVGCYVYQQIGLAFPEVTLGRVMERQKVMQRE